MILSKPDQPQKGSVVIVALCFVTILGIGLASYLAVTNQAMKLSNRSYLKSVSKHLAEIGLERALWAYNRNDWVGPWTYDIVKHTAIHSFGISSSLYGNSVEGTVSVLIENYDATANATEWSSATPYVTGKIVSYGRISDWNTTSGYRIGDIVRDAGTKKRYVCVQANLNQAVSNVSYWKETNDFSDFRRWYRSNSSGVNLNQPPPNSYFWDNCTPIITAEGKATPPPSAGPPIKTQLRGPISTAPLFPNAVGATSTIALSAASIVDSYDSVTDPTASAPGYSATLASTGTTNPAAVTVVNATIKGYIAAPSTPAFSSLTSFGGGASLKNETGPVISPHPTAPNVDLTRISRSPYVPQFAPAVWDNTSGYEINDVVRGPSGDLYRCILAHANPQVPPNSTYWSTSTIDLATLKSSSIGNSTGSPIMVYVFYGDLDLNSGETVTIQGPVILDIHGRIHIRGTGSIVLQNTASAEIHFNGPLSVGSSIAPAAGFDNQLTKDPRKLILVSTVTATPSPNRYWSTVPLYGTIYMPNLASTFNIQSDIYGAISAKSIAFPNPTSLHYDTSLRTTNFHSIEVVYVLTEWRELTSAAEQATFP